MGNTRVIHPPAAGHDDTKKDADTSLTIREDDLSGEATRSLLAFHLQQMHIHSPAGSVFALDLTGLQVPEVSVWTAWQGDQLVAVGALKDLGDATGELKSMRTHPDHLRQGAASAMLEHLIAVATSRGMHRLSLETGSGPAFEAALALYRKRGFTQGKAFGGYTPSPFNQFFHLAL
jgi:putative acetyltransferase